MTKNLVFIIIVMLSLVAPKVVAQDDTTQTLYTASKEVEKVPTHKIDYDAMYRIVIVNIHQCEDDSQRIATIKWYLSILPLKHRLKLQLYVSKNYPHLTYYIKQ